MPAVIARDQAGLLVPFNQPKAFAEAIVRLLLDRPLRERFGRAGRERACEHYSLARMGERLDAFLDSVRRSNDSR